MSLTFTSRDCRLALAAGATLALAVPSAASAATLNSSPATDFRSSIGVNTHMRWTGTPYGDTPISTVQALIRDLGVIRVRDSVCTTTDAGCLAGNQRLADLYNSYGAAGPKVRLDAVIPPLPKDDLDRASRNAKILQAMKNVSVTTPQNGEAISPLSNGIMETIEGTNEPDIYKLGTQDWAATAVGDSYGIVSARSQINGQYGVTPLNWTQVLAPAVGHTADGQLGTLAASPGFSASLWSRANVHAYPPGGAPELAFDAACENYGDVTAPGQPNVTPPKLACARTTYGRSTVEVTETGYNNYLGSCNYGGVSTTASAIYMPRLVLENFRRGVARTYLYELLDLRPAAQYTSSSHAFGLVNARVDSSGKYVSSSAKGAYVSLRNTLSVIGDLGSTRREAGSLDVVVGTPEAPTTDLDENAVRRMLLRRANGSYVLALWQPKALGSWSGCNWSGTGVPAVNARVTLGTAGQSFTVQRYTPYTSASPLATTTGRTLDIPIGADVTLLSIS